MDKIYSRKRFLLPKFNRSRGDIKTSYRCNNDKDGYVYNNTKANSQNYERPKNKYSNKNVGSCKHFQNCNKYFDRIKSKKLFKTAIIVIIAVCIANRIISTIEPTMDILCIDMAKSIATRVSNEQATLVMRKI